MGPKVLMEAWKFHGLFRDPEMPDATWGYGFVASYTGG